MLYIVSTPIGNLKDITLRGLETLKNVSLIAAEDTRHTKVLLAHYGIATALTSYYEHNQFSKSKYLLEILKQGKDVALVSDAGTPGISDPGYLLIKLARDNDVPVTVVPGPTALIAALSLSGLPAHNFIFEGFLPVKSVGRRKKLETFKSEERTIIFYEAPHRLLKALEDIRDVLGDPLVACCRELTKKFEEVKKEKVSHLIAHFSKNPPRGEFAILVNLMSNRTIS